MINLLVQEDNLKAYLSAARLELQLIADRVLVQYNNLRRDVSPIATPPSAHFL
jgi:hypothetical protein